MSEETADKVRDIMTRTENGDNLEGWQLKLVEGALFRTLTPAGNEALEKLHYLVVRGKPFKCSSEEFEKIEVLCSCCKKAKVLSELNNNFNRGVCNDCLITEFGKGE